MIRNSKNDITFTEKLPFDERSIKEVILNTSLSQAPKPF